MMYEYGIGLRPDYVVAYAWYDIGSSEISLKGKDYLAKKMTPDQIAKDGELVKEMIKKNPKLLK